MGGIIRFMIMTDDTYLEVPAERVTIFENLFIEGVSWVAYRNMFDHHQHGRRVMPTDGYPKSLSVLGSLINLNTPQKSKLQELQGWMSRTDENNAVNIQQGNKMFWRHDYMVHKGKNYFTSNRMSSTRVLCSESGNGEGLNNYYTGSGINYIYLTGQEYLEFWDDMNWRRLPGLTAPQKPMTTALPTVPPTSVRGLNGDAFAGGTSDGKTGVTGFRYYKVLDNKTYKEVNVSSYKSVFYLEDYFVVLGAGVNAGKNYGVPFTTTVNQVKFKDNFVVENNGTSQSMTIDQTLAPATSNWAYLNDIGYQFLTNTKLNYEVKTVGATPVAWMAFNHGNLPVNDSYAYAVYPNISQTDFINKTQQTPFVVVSNTSSVQCIIDTVSDITQIIFYRAGRIDLPGEIGFVESNQPVAMQLRYKNDSLFVNVANPYCESRNIFSLTVTLGALFSGETAVTDVINNQTIITTDMPLNEFQGSTQSLMLKNNNFSGLIAPKAGDARLGIYPNKLKAGTPCSFVNTTGNGQVMVAIYRTDGTLAQKQYLTADTENRVTIDTRALTSNIYIVKADSRAGKIIVE
jgi:chondroitin AC lyase